jgi:arylsulfatase A-like enzyme
MSKAHSSWRLPKKLGISEELKEPEYTKAAYQEYLKRYLRCVKGVDDNVKRLIDYLRESGELDNTIIMYTGDQGFFLGEHDLMDKRWMYEEAFRMPFIVHAPRIVKPGSANDWLINNTDFAPTMLELAGVTNTPDYMQGHSFADALKGKAKPADWRKVTYYRYWMHMAHALRVPAHFGVRSERYKLIFFYGCNPDGKGRQTPAAWEFYDLQNDPFEMKNLYCDLQYGKIIETMKVQLKRTRAELNETDEKYPNIQAIIFHYPHYTHATGPFSSIIDDNWKLIRFYNDTEGAYLLYDLSNDPQEQRELSRTNPKKCGTLAKQLSTLLEEMDAEMPIANSRWNKDLAEQKPRFSKNGWINEGRFTSRSTVELAEKEHKIFKSRLK